MPSKRRVLAAAAAAAAAAALCTTSASALPLPPFAPPVLADPAVTAGTEAAHGALADMLAGVLLLREGGVKEAAAALPGLHDLAKAYVLALEALEAAKDVAPAEKDEWAGLTPQQAAALVKASAGGACNATSTVYRAKVGNLTDPLWESGVLLEKKVGGRGESNKTGLVEKLAAKLPDTKAALAAEDPEGAALADAFKAKLADFNVEVSDKIIEKPSKFRNFAALVLKHVSGAMLFDYAVDFNPCLISIMPMAAHLQVTGVNFNPAAVSAMPTAAMAMAQGVNLQPSLLIVSPMGVNVQPQGVQVAPFLVAVSPMGANVQPQGVAVAPAGTAIMPTGKLIAPQGDVYAPTEVMYMPIGEDKTPGGSRHHGGHGGGGGGGGGGDGVGGGL